MVLRILKAVIRAYLHGIEEMGPFILPYILLIGFGMAIWATSQGTIDPESGCPGLSLAFTGFILPLIFSLGGPPE